MLSAINSTIRDVTGYSFSLSNIPKNVGKIVVPTITLVAGICASTASAKCLEDHFDCQLSCSRNSFSRIMETVSVRFQCTTDTCKQICSAYFH